MSDIVGNPEDQFSRVVAQLIRCGGCLVILKEYLLVFFLENIAWNHNSSVCQNCFHGTYIYSKVYDSLEIH